MQAGGSVLPSHSPSIGLLFGYQSGLTISIIDAEEIEYSRTLFSSENSKYHNNIQTMIELHQKVFPKDEVVGWYRASTESNSEVCLPTEEDLKINNCLMNRYKENPVFLLMDASPNDGIQKEDTEITLSRNRPGKEARDKLDRDEKLPLTIYEALLTGGSYNEAASAVFINLEFELGTFEPERVALEKVFQSQPNFKASSTSEKRKTDSTKVIAETGKAKNHVTTISSSVVCELESEVEISPPSASEIRVQSIISSIDQMNARIEVLLDFLRKVQNGDIHPNNEMLRQVDSLVAQLPFMMGTSVFETRGRRNKKNDKLEKEFEDEYEEMLLLSFLACVAKTTEAVLDYSKKFRVSHDSNSQDLRRTQNLY